MILPECKTMDSGKKTNAYIPIYETMELGEHEVTSLYEQFRGPYSFLMESKDEENQIRYSIIALPCMQRFTSNGIGAHLSEEDGRLTYCEGNPLEILENCMNFESHSDPQLPFFTGGMIAHFNYDVVRLVEKLPNKIKESLALPLINGGFVKELLVLDNKEKVIYIIVNIKAKYTKQEYDRAIHRIAHIRDLMNTQGKRHVHKELGKHSIKSNETQASFMKKVSKAKEYIECGELFQVVLSQRFVSDYEEDPFCAYINLRKQGTSPYMYYLDFDDYVISGMSPECLLQCHHRTIQTMPIAGTRKRGKHETEDMKLMEELLHDPKELAEHRMLVDLGRNDLGRVAEIGSVRVVDFMNIQKNSHVMHITSLLKAKLANDKTPLDAFLSVFPAGTLSGAPKIRAMEIIDELEDVTREVYGGSIATIGYEGVFDSCISIRTFLFHNKKVYMQAGAGIVKDSDPQKEYQETIQKASCLCSALKGEFGA